MSICDASSSWSGYQYQGKVGLYVVIKYINDLIKNNGELECEKYSVEFEYREDFSIKYRGYYKSIHQVKARLSDNTINPYLEAMAKLNEEKYSDSNLILYLHPICEIKDWTLEGYKKSLSTIINNLNKKLNDATIKNKHVIQQEKDYYTDLLGKDSFFTNIILYPYPHKAHCSLDDIKLLLFEEIERYFILKNQTHKLGFKDIIYSNFIGFLDEHIKERHKKKVSRDIAFKSIINILDDDKILERDENYYIYLTKERYIYNIHKYCDEICAKRGCCTYNENHCKLISLLEKIEETTLEDFKSLLFKLNPHVEINSWELDNPNFVNQNSIYFLCVMINQEIQQKYKIKDNSLIYVKEMNSYLPTTITEISKYLCQESILTSYIKNMKNNQFLLKELFEYNIFITENLNKNNVLEDIYDVEEIDSDKKNAELKFQNKSFLHNKVDFREIELVKKEINL